LLQHGVDMAAHEAETPPISDEHHARAKCYALIGRLCEAPPDADFLREIGGAAKVSDPQDGPGSGWALVEIDKPSVGGGYPEAYQALQAACRKADVEAVRAEYEQVFARGGKALIAALHESNTGDRHLVALREHLVAWGLARRDSAFEVEDHASAVCDVMRWLIEHGRPLPMQRTFFEEFVHPGLALFSNAVALTSGTSFYRAVGELAHALLAVECEALEIDAETPSAPVPGTTKVLRGA
jgi:TorA maturation chaperone TorD